MYYSSFKLTESRKKLTDGGPAIAFSHAKPSSRAHALAGRGMSGNVAQHRPLVWVRGAGRLGLCLGSGA